MLITKADKGRAISFENKPSAGCSRKRYNQLGSSILNMFFQQKSSNIYKYIDLNECNFDI